MNPFANASVLAGFIRAVVNGGVTVGASETRWTHAGVASIVVVLAVSIVVARVGITAVNGGIADCSSPAWIALTLITSRFVDAVAVHARIVNAVIILFLAPLSGVSWWTLASPDPRMNFGARATILARLPPAVPSPAMPATQLNVNNLVVPFNVTVDQRLSRIIWIRNVHFDFALSGAFSR